MSLSLIPVTSLPVHRWFECRTFFLFFFLFQLCNLRIPHLSPRYSEITCEPDVDLYFLFFFSSQVFGLIAGLLFAYDTYTIYLQIKSSRQHTAASTGEAAHTHWHCVFIYYTLIKVQLHQNVPNWNLNCFFLSCLDDRV